MTSRGGPFADLPMLPGREVVAAGGTLDPALVLDGYRHGVFPFHTESEPVLWWSPDPRAILPLEGLSQEGVHVPRRLARTLRSGRFRVRRDGDFVAVVQGCAREDQGGAWLHGAMRACYVELHRRGHAHSLEVLEDGRLVGGIYGVAIGGAFAAESMFHRVRDASKVALVALARHLRARGFVLLDVQFLTPHLGRFGAVEIPRAAYLERLHAVRDLPVRF